MITATRSRPEYVDDIPDSKAHGGNMGPIRDRQDPGGPHVGPMIFAILDITLGAEGWDIRITVLDIINWTGHNSMRLSDVYLYVYIWWW